MALITDAKARRLSPSGQAVPHGGVTGLTLLPSRNAERTGKVGAAVRQSRYR